MSFSILNKTTYNLYLSSNDRVGGTNNNATYQVNFDDFLPRKYNNYKMIWNLSTTGGLYKDTTSINANVNAIIATGNTTLVFASTTGMFIGMSVSGVGIPSNTYITAVAAGTSVTINNLTTTSIPSGTTMSFTGSIYAGAKVYCNFGGTTYSFDTSNRGASSCIGYINRDPQGTTTSSNTLSCFYSQNPPKTINRPNQHIITIQIYNSQTPLVLFANTDANGNALTDCTAYNMTMEFLPIEDSLVDVLKDSW